MSYGDIQKSPSTFSKVFKDVFGGFLSSPVLHADNSLLLLCVKPTLDDAFGVWKSSLDLVVGKRGGLEGVCRINCMHD